jgi:hypothetical protein
LELGAVGLLEVGLVTVMVVIVARLMLLFSLRSICILLTIIRFGFDIGFEHHYLILILTSIIIAGIVSLSSFSSSSICIVLALRMIIVLRCLLVLLVCFALIFRARWFLLVRLVLQVLGWGFSFRFGFSRHLLLLLLLTELLLLHF